MPEQEGLEGSHILAALLYKAGGRTRTDGTAPVPRAVNQTKVRQANQQKKQNRSKTAYSSHNFRFATPCFSFQAFCSELRMRLVVHCTYRADTLSHNQRFLSFHAQRIPLCVPIFALILPFDYPPPFIFPGRLVRQKQFLKGFCLVEQSTA